jgi:hypothetical protein
VWTLAGIVGKRTVRQGCKLVPEFSASTPQGQELSGRARTLCTVARALKLKFVEHRVRSVHDSHCRPCRLCHSVRTYSGREKVVFFIRVHTIPDRLHNHDKPVHGEWPICTRNGGAGCIAMSPYLVEVCLLVPWLFTTSCLVRKLNLQSSKLVSLVCLVSLVPASSRPGWTHVAPQRQLVLPGDRPTKTVI